MIDVVLQNRDNEIKQFRINTNSLKNLISACSLIEYDKEFSENAHLSILHSSISEDKLTNYYQTLAKRNVGKDNFNFPMEHKALDYNDYYILNMTKGFYIDFDLTALILLCFKGNEYLPSPYRGFCEDQIGEWCGDAIRIEKKSEAKALIKTFEKIYVYFDLGGVIDG